MNDGEMMEKFMKSKFALCVEWIVLWMFVYYTWECFMYGKGLFCDTPASGFIVAVGLFGSINNVKDWHRANES